MVEELAIKRAALLPSQEHALLPPAAALTGGRILAFNPEQNFFDGAAVPVTEGFIDDGYIAAWDTWIMWVTDDECNGDPLPWYTCDSYLLCWIPEVLVDSVDDAIAVDPGSSLLWARELATVFMEALKQAGLVR
jgi:hypothetical protein